MYRVGVAGPQLSSTVRRHEVGMNVAVELGFDAASEGRLRAIWSTLELIYGHPQRSDLGVRPHLSLAVFSGPEPVFLERELQALAGRFDSFSIHLATARSFPTAEGVVYLAPSPSESLREIHSVFHAALSERGEPGHPYYRPDAWIPHCTVATDVPPHLLDQVKEACQRAAGFGQATVESVHAVAYRPARDLCCFPLRRSRAV